VEAYQGACEIDACGPGVGAVEPGWRGKAEEAAGCGHGGQLGKAEKL
jgi:hypothetical protein